MTDTHRHGPLGALLDEYERATDELPAVLQPLSAAEFTAVRDEARMMPTAARFRPWCVT